MRVDWLRSVIDWMRGDGYPLVMLALIVLFVVIVVIASLVMPTPPTSPTPPANYEATPPATFCRIMADSAGGYDDYCWPIAKN